MKESSVSQQKHFAALDGLRGLAALHVMLGHAIWVLWQTSNTGDFWSLANKLISFLLRYGRQAVMLFFLLSGFVIHIGMARRVANGNSPSLAIKSYVLRRALRLYPPLLFTLPLTAILDWIGISVNAPLYAGSIEVPFTIIFVNRMRSWLTAAGNLLFLHSYSRQLTSFGTNSPLWSLSYEAFFYLLYPLVYLPFYRRIGPNRTFVLTSLISVGALSITLLAGGSQLLDHIIFWVVWTCGAWLADLVARGKRLPHGGLWLTGAVVALALLMVGRKLSVEYHIRDLVWSGVLAVLVFVAASNHTNTGRVVRFYKQGLASAGWLAPFSYTLYLIHFPVFILVAGLWLVNHTTLPESGWLALTAIGGVFVASFGLAKLLEAPFVKGGKFRKMILP